MNVHFSYDAPRTASDSGMARFLNPINIERYRRLASQKTNATKRARLLKILAAEWTAFIRECDASSLKDSRVLKTGWQMTPAASEGSDHAMH
jgi:hypothetical protein